MTKKGTWMHRTAHLETSNVGASHQSLNAASVRLGISQTLRQQANERETLETEQQVGAGEISAHLHFHFILFY